MSADDEERPGDAARGASEIDWGALDADEVAARLLVDPDRGLSGNDAARRLDEAGPNRIQRVRRDPPWRLFVDQFRSPLILLLLGAAAVAAAVGKPRDALVIGAVLTLNAVLGFAQEYRAQKSMTALRELLTFTARVRREGREVEIDGADVVPGDVVLLTAGDRVPADGRVVAGDQLAVDESSLTGESAPVDKSAAATAEGVGLAERTAEVFMGTTVVRGEGSTMATRTGMGSAMGRVSARMHRQEDRSSPLERRLASLAGRLSIMAILAAAVVVALALAQGDTLGDALIDGVVLAVASIPEGLPAIVTVTLALGVRAMARRGAIVEDLQAIHSLGAATAVCTDKTGTLTLNQMTVRCLDTPTGRYEVTGEGYETTGELRAIDGDEGDGAAEPRGRAQPPRAALEIAVLCNDAHVDADGVAGDPTEAALVVLGAKAGLTRDELEEDRPRVAEVPFSSDRKYMATFHDTGDGCEVLAKGAPAVLIERCATLHGPGGEARLDDGGRRRLGERVDALTSEGYRVLALARVGRADVPAADADEAELEAEVAALCFEGLVAMEDPPRLKAFDAVDQCRSAGIAVKMVTGDHARTAEAIARRLGITGGVLEGRELAELDDDELAGRIDAVGVLARVEPEDKVRVVNALAANGHVVAMTGDGVNDAAALDAADVGIAMGQRGTEVAKEAGDVVLTDDRITTVVAAVRHGRAIYDNILTFVRFNLATNLGALLTILTARALGLPTPFTPLQVLWVNLIMDGPPAMALGADAPAPDVMRRPPRDPDAPILDRARALTLVGLGGWMAVGALVAFSYGRDQGGDELGITLAFTTFVLFQAVNAVNVRTGWHSVFSRRTLTNPALWVALAVVVTLQVVVVQLPMAQGLFDTQPLSVGQWLLAAGLAASIVVLSEASRLAYRRFGPGPAGAGSASGAQHQPRPG